MGNDLAGSRYRALYNALLRLYPQPFRQRFSQELTQTFVDLCRERQAANRPLFPLALWILTDTLMAILRENTTRMTQANKLVLRAALVALGLWMVPVVASQFVADWRWGLGGFAFCYVMFFATSLAYGLIARTRGAWAYKTGVGLALVAGFVMGWSSMVHMSESENPGNLIYFGVLAVGAVGAWLARLQPPGMARALFAMAATLAMVGAVSVLLSLDVPSGPIRNVAIMHALFVAIFNTSGLLFRHASRRKALRGVN